jgi:hypothetical protein
VLRELLPKERAKKCPFLNIKDPLTDHLVLRANFVGSILNKPAAARCCPGCHNRRGAADGASSSADQSLSSSPPRRRLRHRRMQGPRRVRTARTHFNLEQRIIFELGQSYLTGARRRGAVLRRPNTSATGKCSSPGASPNVATGFPRPANVLPKNR